MEDSELTEDKSYSIFEYTNGEYVIYRSDIVTRRQIRMWCKDLFGDNAELSKVAHENLELYAEELSDIRRLIIYPGSDGVYEITEDVF